MYRKLMAFLALAAIIVTVVAFAGCAGTSKNDNTISGKDLFDPQKFSMAIYNVTTQGASGLPMQEFQVISHPGEPEGNRLTSITIQDNGSTRADTMISSDGSRTKSVLITAINQTDVQMSGGELSFNMTVLDNAWNSLGDTYGLVGHASVSTPAGQYDDCSIYSSNKTLYFGNTSTFLRVSYYIHSSSPVPVQYTVEGPSGKYTYTLQSVYKPGDNDSAPGRVVEAFFDDLDNNRPDSAFKYLATYDAVNNKFKSPDDDTYRQFLDNMNRTYGLGDQSYHIQYVQSGGLEPGVTLGGYQTPLIRWNSIHYLVGNMYAYRLDGSFYMVNLNGHWRIIV